MFKFCLFAVVVFLAGGCFAAGQVVPGLTLSTWASYLALTNWLDDDEDDDDEPTADEYRRGIRKHRNGQWSNPTWEAKK